MSAAAIIWGTGTFLWLAWIAWILAYISEDTRIGRAIDHTLQRITATRKK